MNSPEINASVEAEIVPSDSRALYFRDVRQHDLLDPEEEASLAKQKAAGVAASEMLEQAIDVSPEQIERLETVMTLGEHATQSLVSSNLKLVADIARKYVNNGNQQHYLDAIQEGNIGLMRAVELFDHKKGYKFSTYTTWWIHQAIGRSRSSWDGGKVVNIPVEANRIMRKLSRYYDKQVDEDGKSPDDAIDALSERFNMDREKVVDYLNLHQRHHKPASLDKPVGEEGDSVLGDLLPSTQVTSPEAAGMQSQAHDQLRDIIDQLFPKRENGEHPKNSEAAKKIATQNNLRTVLQLRYFSHDGDGELMTVEDIGEIMGITHQRVSQLLRASHIKLQRHYEKQGVTSVHHLL